MAIWMIWKDLLNSKNGGRKMKIENKRCEMKLKRTKAVIDCKAISNALDREKEAYFAIGNLKCQIKRFDWIGYPYLCGYVFIKPSKKEMSKIQNDCSEEITYDMYQQSSRFKCLLFPKAEKIGFDMMHYYNVESKNTNDLKHCLNLIDELVDLCVKHTRQGKANKKERIKNGKN